MNRTEIIIHYKNFFNLNSMELDVDDHLHIDWAEALIEEIETPTK